MASDAAVILAGMLANPNCYIFKEEGKIVPAQLTVMIDAAAKMAVALKSHSVVANASRSEKL